jgi:transcriptional regulator GlxA family with amidase domain
MRPPPRRFGSDLERGLLLLAPTECVCVLRKHLRCAQDLLENTDDTIERIATLCGFGNAHQMRTHFTRINHVTPHAYQRTFRPNAAA